MDKNSWHLTIRKYSGTGSPEEIGVRVRAGWLPLLRRHPGFQAYFAARIDGGGGVFAVAVFDAREAALAANTQALEWARAELTDLLTSPPEVTLARVERHHSASEAGGGSYLMVRRNRVLAPSSSQPPSLQEALVALTLRQPGFRHLYEGRDEAQEDQAVAVGVFTNRDTATAAHAQAVALMAKHREVWPTPAELPLAGEVLVQAIA